MPGVESLVSFAPFFVPVITGLVGGISIVIRDRREARSADHHYRRRLEKAQMEVQFIISWIEAKKLAPTADPTADAAPTADPGPGSWLDECYASVRRFEAATNRQDGGPGRLRRLLLIRPLGSGPARSLRVLYWAALLAFNASLAWWVSMVVDGPPAFFGADAASRSEGVDAVLGLAGCFLLAAVVLWMRTVHLEASKAHPPRIDSAAWARRAEEWRRAEERRAGRKAERKARRKAGGRTGGRRG